MWGRYISLIKRPIIPLQGLGGITFHAQALVVHHAEGVLRACLIGRVATTMVMIDLPLEKEAGVLLLSGNDSMGFNRIVAPPG